MSTHALHRRLKEAIGTRSFREIEELTGINHESARRYVQGYAPPAEFLSAICSVLKINAEWLMLGQGPMFRHEARGQALVDANATDLLSTLAKTLESLIERIERLETFVQTLEGRLRVSLEQHAQVNHPAARRKAERLTDIDHPHSQQDEFLRTPPLQSHDGKNPVISVRPRTATLLRGSSQDPGDAVADAVFEPSSSAVAPRPRRNAGRNDAAR